MTKKVSVGVTVFICLLVGLLSFLSGMFIFGFGGETSDAADKMEQIMEYYEKYYVGEFDKEEAEEIALKYLVAGTGDRYGYYYTAEEFEELMNQQTGELVGIGIMTDTTGDPSEGIVVARVMPDSPAEGAGLKAGDLITAVDGTTAKEVGYEALSAMIGGKEDTAVKLTVLRDGKSFDIEIIRKKISFETVIYGYHQESKTGVIRIIEFIENTPEQFKNALDNLKEMGAEKFVFDLRDNPGGLLDSVLEITENFLPKDAVITSLVKKNGAKQDYKVKEGAEYDYPTAILINGGSASASELFTSAMRDHNKAVLIGENSYGKGVGQSFVQFSDGSAMKLTNFYYNPPSGVNFDGEGIEPNIKIALDEGEEIDYYNVDFNDKVIKKAIDELKKSN